MRRERRGAASEHGHRARVEGGGSPRHRPSVYSGCVCRRTVGASGSRPRCFLRFACSMPAKKSLVEHCVLCRRPRTVRVFNTTQQISNFGFRISRPHSETYTQLIHMYKHHRSLVIFARACNPLPSACRNVRARACLRQPTSSSSEAPPRQRFRVARTASHTRSRAQQHTRGRAHSSAQVVTCTAAHKHMHVLRRHALVPPHL